tara:strand:+ start:456 stop:1295 length:840 start_codon:yes stop_codon:yes gene_type:complete
MGVISSFFSWFKRSVSSTVEETVEEERINVVEEALLKEITHRGNMVMKKREYFNTKTNGIASLVRRIFHLMADDHGTGDFVKRRPELFINLKKEIQTLIAGIITEEYFLGNEKESIDQFIVKLEEEQNLLQQNNDAISSRGNVSEVFLNRRSVIHKELVKHNEKLIVVMGERRKYLEALMERMRKQKKSFSNVMDRLDHLSSDGLAKFVLMDIRDDIQSFDSLGRWKEKKLSRLEDDMNRSEVQASLEKILKEKERDNLKLIALDDQLGTNPDQTEEVA